MKVWKIGFRRRRLVGRSGFQNMGVASWHIGILTLLDSLYIWAGLSLVALEPGGWVAYMETHPYCIQAYVSSTQH
jgi:hypothetical protein